jgi:hypothetical protein
MRTATTESCMTTADSLQQLLTKRLATTKNYAATHVAAQPCTQSYHTANTHRTLLPHTTLQSTKTPSKPRPGKTITVALVYTGCRFRFQQHLAAYRIPHTANRTQGKPYLSSLAAMHAMPQNPPTHAWVQVPTCASLLRILCCLNLCMLNQPLHASSTYDS